MKRIKTNDSRRRFLQTSAVAGFGLFAAPAILAEKSPNAKLQIGCIGVGGRGGANIAELTAETKGSEKLYAFCDVNSKTLQAQSDKYQVEHRYKDFRELFDKHGKELDAVFIGTLDHTHGIIACSAMELGLHCYCEKPLANSVWETRQMANFAAKKNLCTQTGTQVRSWRSGEAAHYYRGIEWVRSGAVGKIKEVHIWCQGTYVPAKDPTGESPIPEWLDYDLWLGPMPFRPYNEMWLSFSKYGFWHSGHGWIGGMGPHTIDLAWTALNLGTPRVIENDGPEPPHPLYNRDEQHVIFTVSGDHPITASREIQVHWYDGKTRRPKVGDDGIAADAIDAKPQAGVLFVGESGNVQVHYDYHKLLPAEQFKDFQPPQQTIPQSVGHHKQWLDAIKAGKPEQCECRFEYAHKYMEAIGIAAMMHRSAVKKVAWDAEKMTTDSESVNKLLQPEFRSGWRFPEI
ncbi:MAG: Gfo/Idh/MocA family oxidoreductase [Planctomycetaceae bacterium]|jgi:predicted dehydrogenase|nr:Gfo/Idh/MocA family oxidoreductase [Planctomycetaceae bacterium]